MPGSLTRPIQKRQRGDQLQLMPANGVDAPKPQRPTERLRWSAVCTGTVLAIGLSAVSVWAGRIWGQNEWVWSTLPNQDVEMVFRGTHFPNGAILSAPPDPNYVCHDWTFFGGVSDPRCDDIEKHLKDAGYIPVNDPRVGDVIIYRDASGRSIVHSGIVKAIGDRNFVLIESKWGDRGRYIHLPTVSGLTTNHSYYRLSAGGAH